MEQTHLISVCVFCLLCATHIHCSEYSPRTVKSRMKPKGDNLSMEKLERAPNITDVNGTSRVFYPVSVGKSQEMAEGDREFLKPSQKPPGSHEESMGDFGSHLHSENFPVRTVLDDSNKVQSSRNNIQSVNKYIKIPEPVRMTRGANFEGFERTLGGVLRKKRSEGFAPVFNEQLYIESLFKKYRNSDNRIDLNGFKTMLSHLGLKNFALRDWREEHINSMELRDGDHMDNGHTRHPNHGNRSSYPGECLSPENLLRAVVRENMENTSDVSHGEKRPEHFPEDGPKEESNEESGYLYLSKTLLLKLCPFLIYQLVEPQTCFYEHLHDGEVDENQHLLAWLYATASVIIVSLCGLLGVFVIPIMGHAFYQQLLQFLVALAVGTLCGDALLHLLPHAMIPHSDEAHIDSGPHDHDHTATMWKGLAVLLGIVFFFFTEKCLTLASEWRKKHQRNKKVQGHSHVQILNGSNESESVGEKLCKHKYSSYPYCYPDIKSNKDGHEHTKHVPDPSKRNNLDDRDLKTALVPKWHDDAKDASEHQRLTQAPDMELRENEKQNTIDDEQMTVGEDGLQENEVSCGRRDGEYTVIIREHESSHHGHSHAHGHVHSPPESLSSVAWMVILGDGLHNFTDGMAIGAAFANNIAGGFSTAVAVFCHELPHELGDFAVLIKAGMSAKQAVFYNLISSILCFFGMCLGIFVGDNPQSTSWVFAVSAGMFLYIGLVDMFPELTSSHSAKESSFCQCSLQGLGLISGVSIMLIIAFYEDQLLTLFK